MRYITRLTMVVALQAAILAAAPADGRRPFQLEDVVAFKTIREARVSPDGSRVAFIVRAGEADQARFTTRLWVAATDGSSPARPLTSDEAPHSAPRWSPDGTRIAFLAGRGEQAQVWVVPAEGGAPQQLSKHEAGVSTLEWSPDGRRLLLIASGPGKPPDPYVLGRQWRNQGLWSMDAAGGPATALTDRAEHVRSAAWSPDGRRIAFIATPDPEADSSQEARARVLEVDTRTVADVPDGGLASSVSWSPDGHRLAFVRAFDRRGWSREDLYVWTLDEKAARNLTSGVDRDVESVHWTPAGDAIDVRYSRGAKTEVGRVRLDGGAPAVAWAPGFPLAALERAGTGWVFVRGDRPAELARGGPGGQPPVALTRLNPGADAIELPAVEVVQWNGDAGPVEGVLVHPARLDPSRRYPLIVNPHGGPRGHTLAELDPQSAYFASLGYVVLRPNFRGSTGYGDEFAKRNRADWGTGPFADVMGGVDALVARGIADPGRLFIYGWSYGGILTNWAVTHTDRFRAAASGAGVADYRMQYSISDSRRWRFDYFGGSPFAGHQPLYERESPVTYVSQARVPTLFLHGEKDERVPLPQGLMMHRALRDAGVETEMVVYPREGHGFEEPRHIVDRARRVAEWFRRHDPGAEPAAGAK
ncbi:MAG TPA: S9 family peptidase [Vicinamibacteria bacterium]